MPRRRPEAWRTGYAIRGSGGGLTAATVFGNEWFFSSTAASKGNGKNPDTPTDDFDSIMAQIGDEDAVYIAGDLRWQGSAPADTYGVKIIGAFGGRPRHVTSGGVAVTGNGGAWRQEATAANAPLLILSSQGWEFHNMMFVPESGYGSVRLYRTATDSVDGSHSKFVGCRFVSPGTRVGYGVEDYGGHSHCSVEGCEFDTLEYAIYQSNAGIDWANRWLIDGNFFRGNKYDIVLNSKMSRITRNVFGTVFNGSTHPKTIDTKGTADGSVPNHVLENYLPDTAAEVVQIAKGYVSATGDVWRNYATDQAAAVVAVPS